MFLQPWHSCKIDDRLHPNEEGNNARPDNRVYDGNTVIIENDRHEQNEELKRELLKELANRPKPTKTMSSKNIGEQKRQREILKRKNSFSQ